MQSQVKYTKTQLSLLLIHLSCQILKICFAAKAIQAFVSVSINARTASPKLAWSRKSEKQ